ncbi:hypothetical protein [Nocardia sp. NPDC052566]|uniref:hypothetical protein n=1 Tax=Nocardia sp. NPDC052566 TaxID=3364330 RepID=UPI0037C91D57
MGTVGRWDLVFPSCAPERAGDLFATAVVADAVRRFDADLAQEVETCRNWQSGYRTVFRALTALAASSAPAATGIAADGLHAARTLLRFAAGYSVAPLDSVALGTVVDPATDALETGRVDGTAEPLARLEVPYRGTVLAEDSLRRELIEWRRRGIVEPGFADAVGRVIDHPEWLALPGFRVIVAGAAALSPLRPLLRWGAEVLAVDLPGQRRWQELSQYARAGAGVLRFPITRGPGADLVRQFPALIHWIRGQFDDPAVRPVFGGYANRPGPHGVRLAAATDLLAVDLLDYRADAALAFLGAPTDCYAVPESVVAQARERLFGHGLRGVLQEALCVLTRSALYTPNYGIEITDELGARWSVADALVTAQGPNHAMAQRIQRWRATVAQRAGHTVSFTVAPPTLAGRLPRSLAASYRGAHHFGIEVFESDTARTLLAAKLVADLNHPVRSHGNPEALFATGAVHGGLWRQPFEPRSILPVAMIAGYARGLLRR